MAKNVQIIPASGSLEFLNDSTGGTISLTLSGSDDLFIKSGSDEIVSVSSAGPSSFRFKIDGDKTFKIPVKAGIPAPPNIPGDIFFESIRKGSLVLEEEIIEEKNLSTINILNDLFASIKCTINNY